MKGGWIWCSRRKRGDFFQFSRTLNKGTDVGMILRHTGDFETHLFVWLVVSGGFLMIMVVRGFSRPVPGHLVFCLYWSAVLILLGKAAWGEQGANETRLRNFVCIKPFIQMGLIAHSHRETPRAALGKYSGEWDTLSWDIASQTNHRTPDQLPSSILPLVTKGH